MSNYANPLWGNDSEHCPFCKVEIVPDEEHCDNCGACLPPHVISIDDEWCEYCSAPIEHDGGCMRPRKPRGPKSGATNEGSKKWPGERGRWENEIPPIADDYETCADCGYDHHYEPAEAQLWHATNGAPSIGIEPNEDIESADRKLRGEAVTLDFDRFMDRTLLDEARTRRTDGPENNPQRQRAAKYQDRPLNKTRFTPRGR